MRIGSGRIGLDRIGIDSSRITYSINAVGTVALAATPHSINARGNIADWPTPHSINAGGIISQSHSVSINAVGKIAQSTGPHSINAGGTVANAPTALSINAVGNIAESRSTSINIVGAISEPKSHYIYVSGIIQGFCEYFINAKGAIGEWVSPYSINAIGNIGESHIDYIYARGIVAQEHSHSIGASGLIQGEAEYFVNAGGNIADWPTPHSINAGGTIGVYRSESINISGKIAESRETAINVGGIVSLHGIYAINATGKVALARSNLVYARGNISDSRSTSINAGGKISGSTIHVINAICHISQTRYASINIRGYIASSSTSYSINASGFIIASPYYRLNGFVFDQSPTSVMLEGLKSQGPEKKFTKRSIPNQEDIILLDDGFDEKTFTFETFHHSEDDAFSYSNQVMTPALGDMRFYPGSSLWFHKVKSVNVMRERRRASKYIVLRNQVDLEKPWLYFDLPEQWVSGDVNLPRTSTDIDNSGHYDTPLETLKITGRYYSGGHPKAITYAVLDGLTEISSIYLSDQLLSDEIITFDEDGYLTCEYEDDFASGTRFSQDTSSSNASVADGKLTINSGGYVIYVLHGPWPCIRNVLLETNMNVVSGSPLVEYSNDGVDWDTAIETTDINSGVDDEYYIVGSDHTADIHIKFSCPTGSKLEISNLKFTAVRRTKGSITPTIEKGTTRQIRISDDFTSTHRVAIESTFRSQRRAI